MKGAKVKGNYLSKSYLKKTNMRTDERTDTTAHYAFYLHLYKYAKTHLKRTKSHARN